MVKNHLHEKEFNVSNHQIPNYKLKKMKETTTVTKKQVASRIREPTTRISGN